MSQIPQDAQDSYYSSAPVIRGELAPPGYVDPASRSYDPLASGPPPQQSAAVQPYALQPDASQPYAPQPYAPVGHPGAGPYGAMPAPAPGFLPTKSVGVAFLLTFLFGPLGMLYSTVGGALVMIGIDLVLAVLTGIIVFVISLLTLGVGSVLVILAPLVGIPTWIASIIWGCLAASRHNERMHAQFATAGGYLPPGY